MSSTTERRVYCPLVTLTDETGKQFLALDYTNAAYEGLKDQRIGFESFQVTDTEAGQPDAIAYRFYGESTLWWVICTFNDIIDPYSELTPGTKLRIPHLDEVMLYLNRNQTTSSRVVRGNQVGAIGEL